MVSRVLAQSGAGEKVMQGERFLKGENQKKSQDPESNRDILICSQPRSLSAILASGAVHNCDLTYQCRQRYYLREHEPGKTYQIWRAVDFQERRSALGMTKMEREKGLGRGRFILLQRETVQALPGIGKREILGQDLLLPEPGKGIADGTFGKEGFPDNILLGHRAVCFQESVHQFCRGRQVPNILYTFFITAGYSKDDHS